MDNFDIHFAVQKRWNSSSLTVRSSPSFYKCVGLLLIIDMTKLITFLSVTSIFI